MRHSNNFDGLRMFAAILVLVSHQFPLTGRVEPSFGELSLGSLGVSIFFSISGYLIALSWVRSVSLRAFATARFLRIWPGCAAVTILATFVLGPLVSTQTGGYYTASETLRYLRTLVFDIQYRLPGVFLDNPYPNAVNGSLWTIPLELTWYLILAGLGLTGLLRRPLVMLVAFLLIWTYVLQQRYMGHVGHAPPLFEFGVFFLAGAALSTIRTWLVVHGKTIFGLALIVVLTAGSFDLVYGVLFVVVPPIVIVVGETATAVLRQVGRFGDVSYGFYLYAFPTQQTIVWLTDNKLSLPAGIAMSAAIALVLAFGSWRFVERPAMRLNSRMRASTERSSD